MWSGDAQLLQKSASHFTILGASRVPKNKFHTGDPPLDATFQNLVTRETWHVKSVHPLYMSDIFVLF